MPWKAFNVWAQYTSMEPIFENKTLAWYNENESNVKIHWNRAEEILDSSWVDSWKQQSQKAQQVTPCNTE